MSTARVRIQPAIIADVEVDLDRLTVRLTDGRELSAPLSISPRLSSATRPQRDQDIGVWTLLGVPEDLVLEAAGFRRPD